jgi:hypothetical protein
MAHRTLDHDVAATLIAGVVAAWFQLTARPAEIHCSLARCPEARAAENQPRLGDINSD